MPAWKDAVNGSQLNNTNQKVVEYLGGGAGYDNITQSFNNPTYTVGHGSTAQQYNNVGGAIDALNQADAALGNRITNLGDQLQQAFYSTNERINDVEKRANAGIAAAMAQKIALIFQVNIPMQQAQRIMAVKMQLVLRCVKLQIMGVGQSLVVSLRHHRVIQVFVSVSVV